MGNNGKKTEKKRRNYWIIGLVLASSVILLYILIYLSFAGKGFIPTGKYLTKGDWLAFFGTYLSFVGATLVSVIALVQTHIYAKKQHSRDLAVRKKQIQPIFSVEIIDIDQQLPGTAEAVGHIAPAIFLSTEMFTLELKMLQSFRFEMLLFLTDIIFSCLNRMNLKIFMWFIRIHQMRHKSRRYCSNT